MSDEQGRHSFRERLGKEMRIYAAIALYLFVCFTAVLSYKAAVLAEVGHSFGPLAFAAVKALVLAKFIMLGNAAFLRDRFHDHHLVAAAVTRTLAMLAILIGLILIEEMASGLIHGRTALESLRALMQGRGWEVAASSVLLWLILLPYVGLGLMRARLGEEAWQRLLASRLELRRP